MHAVEIRRAAPNDADELTSIAFAAKEFWGYSSDAMQSWADVLTVTSATIAESPTFTAHDGQAIVGFYMLSNEGALWELEHLWVKPGCMRRGTGRRLLAHALETARDGGARELRIDADPNAENFYRACGAVRVGSVPAPIPEDPSRVRPILSVALAQ